MFGGPPVDEQTREDYFESLYYSAAVVGITTTAFLDAAVVGRPVMSFHANDLVPEHEASLHFQYLMDAERGLLTMADSLEDHARQLAVRQSPGRRWTCCAARTASSVPSFGRAASISRQRPSSPMHWNDSLRHRA